MVEIHVLGPIRLVIDGLPTDRLAPKPRLVLARLAAGRGNIVSDDVLIDVIWRNPPRTARKTLNGYVHQLRRVLGAGTIVREGSGYRLHDVEYDVNLVERTLAQAREFIAQENPHEAIRLLKTARDQFRGRALPELDDDGTMTGIKRQFEELEMTVTEELYETTLAIGHHASIVGELESIVAADPTRERMWCMLAEALMACGRQADALHALSRARRALALELGVEPGPLLRELEFAILEQRAEPFETVGVQHPPRSRNASVRAGNLPIDRGVLVGRQDDLDRLVGMLTPGAIATLSGVGGVGKTRLAIAAAHGIPPARFADGIWVAELANATTSDQVYAIVAAALGLLKSTEGLTPETIAAAIASQSRLIIIDNCEHVVEAAASLVDEISRRCARTAVLATSRESLGISNERVVVLHPLNVTSSTGRSEAAQLVCDCIQRADAAFDPSPDELDLIDEICDRLDGIPLALELAAGRVRALGVRGVSDRVSTSFDLLSRRRSQTGRHQSVRAAIAWSFDLLSPAEQRLFTRLSVFTGGFDIDAAYQVCGAATESEICDGVESLVDKSLVTTYRVEGITRYRQLEPVRQFGERVLAERGDGDETEAGHMAYYLTWSQSAAAGIRGRNELAWHHRFVAEWPNLRKAVKRAIDTQDANAACGLVCNVSLWAKERLILEVGEWAESAFYLPSADSHPLSPAVGATASVVARTVGDVSKAERLFAAAHERQSALGEAAAPWRLHASSYQVAFGAQASSGTAEDNRAQATTNDATNDPFEGAQREIYRLLPTLCRLAVLDVDGLDVEDALRQFEALVDTAERVGNPTLLARAQTWHGAAMRTLDPETALTLLETALAAAERLHARRLVYQIDMDLGPLYASLGRPHQALIHLQPRLERFVQAGAVQQAWSDSLAALPALAALGRSDLTCLALGHLRGRVPPVWQNYWIAPTSVRQARAAVGEPQAERLTQLGSRLSEMTIVSKVLDAMKTLSE